MVMTTWEIYVNLKPPAPLTATTKILYFSATQWGIKLQLKNPIS